MLPRHTHHLFSEGVGRVIYGFILYFEYLLIYCQIETLLDQSVAELKINKEKVRVQPLK